MLTQGLSNFPVFLVNKQPIPNQQNTHAVFILTFEWVTFDLRLTALVAKVTHSGEGIQVENTYYKGRLSNYEANYTSSCWCINKNLIPKL
jgi:hypothetical protein